MIALTWYVAGGDQILALERANHPNCVALMGIYESPSKIFIATEL